jgi:protein-disulfide isomerase
MSKYRWLIFAAVVVLLLGGLVVWQRLANPKADVSNVNGNSIIAANEQNGSIADHILGSRDSKVTLVEYGDFQCPGCLAAHPNVKSLTGEYGDRITFIFRNFPLRSIHPNALAAASAAEAAGLQGKYWEMHDLLFDDQAAWKSLSASDRTPQFVRFAQQLGLDTAKFEKDIASAQVAQKISFDEQLGRNQKVDSTPTFILNGEIVPESASRGILQGDLTEIKKLIDEKLN